MLMSSWLSWIQVKKLLEVQHQCQAGGGWEAGGRGVPGEKREAENR